MDLGSKLKQARLEAGLSQRQLCGDTITRNMLSLIENSAARPSMDTLAVLATRLGKSIGYFLGEEETKSPREQRLAEHLEILAGAASAAAEGRNLYGAQLLEAMEFQESDYCREELNRRRLLLLGQLCPQRSGELCEKLPSLDDELRLRAEGAMSRKNWERAGALLDSMESRNSLWNYLRGEVWRQQGAYENAIACYLAAEKEMPEKTLSGLEYCYRELGDYKQAYYYACKRK